jgi:predicted dehydrogenase
MLNKKIKWGIVGPGIIAHQFASDFRWVDNGELIAVASRDKGRAQAFADTHSVAKAYEGYQSLYDDDDVDAVYIATPHNFHFENAKAALQAGKAVMCEKPIAIHPSELVELIQIAKASSGYLMEAMWTYFLPAIIKSQEWVKSGRIGKILQVKADFGYSTHYDPMSRMYNPHLAGGVLLDMGIYPISVPALMIDALPEQVKVVVKKAKTGVDSEVTMLFEYGDGSLANLCASFRAKLNNWAYIIGEKGYIALPDFWRASECFLYEGDHIIDHYDGIRDSFGYHYETHSMNEDLLLGRKKSVIMSHEMSMKLQKMMASVKAYF